MDSKEPQSKIMMAVICWFLGWAGIHRMMMGYSNWWMMLVASFFVVGYFWALYDLVMILTGGLKMADGRELV